MGGDPRAQPQIRLRETVYYSLLHKKTQSREKARREESEDEGNEMILGSWTFIFLSGKNRAREER